MNTKIRFCEKDLRALVPKPNRYELLDPELQGFMIRVLPSGKKVFFVRYPLSGRRERLGLWGPLLTLEQARAKAQQLLTSEALLRHAEVEIVQSDGSLLLRPGTPLHIQVLKILAARKG